MPPTPSSARSSDTPAEAPQGATTLLETYDALRDVGYTGQLIAREGPSILCTSCNSQTPIADWSLDGARRIEGASDPADLNLVTWAACPRCRQRGVLTLGYGPNASVEDAAVLDAVSLDDSSTLPTSDE